MTSTEVHYADIEEKLTSRRPVGQYNLTKLIAGHARIVDVIQSAEIEWLNQFLSMTTGCLLVTPRSFPHNHCHDGFLYV